MSHFMLFPIWRHPLTWNSKGVHVCVQAKVGNVVLDPVNQNFKIDEITTERWLDGVAGLIVTLGRNTNIIIR